MSTREILHRSLSVTAYAKGKLEMLKKDFKFNLSTSEIEHMNTLTTEIAVDNYAKKLIYEHL